MDLERKLMKICSSVQELKQTQEQLLQRLDGNKCTSPSDDVVKQLTQLDSHVCKLESQFGQHCNSLKAVTELVFKLLDKLQHLNITIEQVKCSEHSVEESYDVTTCSLSSDTNSGRVEKSPAQKHRLIDKSRLKYLVKSTSHETSLPDGISNGSTKLNLTEKTAQNDGNSNSCGSFRGCELGIESPLDISGLDDNKSCMKGEVKYKTSLSLGSVHTSFDNNDSEGGRTKLAKNNKGIPELTHSKKCISKNDFGYKRKLPEIKYDNRVSFHGNQACFQGEMCISKVVVPEERSDLPNIPVTKRPSEQRSKKAVQAYGDNTVVTNPGEVWQPVSRSDWFQFAEQTRKHANFRVQSRSVQRGKRGHDVILVLDTSERMKGHKFSLIKSKAIEYVTGIKQVYLTSDLEDNIGLVIFGGQSRLVQESTSNYDLIIELIGILGATSSSFALVDDISCITTSHRALQYMVDICCRHSLKYCNTADKSAVLWYSVSLREEKFKYQWRIGDENIHVDIS